MGRWWQNPNCMMLSLCSKDLQAEIQPDIHSCVIYRSWVLVSHLPANTSYFVIVSPGSHLSNGSSGTQKAVYMTQQFSSAGARPHPICPLPSMAYHAAQCLALIKSHLLLQSILLPVGLLHQPQENICYDAPWLQPATPSNDAWFAYQISRPSTMFVALLSVIDAALQTNVLH